MANPREMPWFYFRLRYIVENLPHHIPPATDENDNWRPPSDHTHFRQLQETLFELDGQHIPQDSLFLWQPGRVEVANQLQHWPVQPYRCTSLYWSHDAHNYLVLPFDCTSANSEAPPDPPTDSNDDQSPPDIHPGNQSPASSPPAQEASSWRRLRFRRRPGNRLLSLVGYCQEYKQLGAPVDARWRRYLLPATNFVEPDPLLQGTAQLAGNLNILIGLIAFCTEKEQSIRAIRDTFWANTQERRRWAPCHGMEPFGDRKQ